MLWLLVILVTAVLEGCTGSHVVVSGQESNNNMTQHTKYEPAPIVDPIDYHMPPDSRDKFCGESRLENRNNSFSMATNPTTGYYCF